MKLSPIAGALALALVLSTPFTQAATQQNVASTAIMMQGFHWTSTNQANWYGTIQGKAADMKNLGITHVWFPPASDSAAKEG